jgi:hypothetical protein
MMWRHRTARNGPVETTVGVIAVDAVGVPEAMPAIPGTGVDLAAAMSAAGFESVADDAPEGVATIDGETLTLKQIEAIAAGKDEPPKSPTSATRRGGRP